MVRSSFVCDLEPEKITKSKCRQFYWTPCIESSRGNGQVSDVTGSAGVMGRYLAKAIISDKSK